MARFSRGHSKRYIPRGTICPYCGSYHRGINTVCGSCNAEPNTKTNVNDINKPIQGEGIGFILGIFGGLIGALVCHFLGDYDARRNGWHGFLCGIPFKVFFVIILFILLVG